MDITSYILSKKYIDEKVSEEQIGITVEKIISKPDSSIASKDELKIKYDDVILDNNILTFKANGIDKKSIELPINSGSDGEGIEPIIPEIGENGNWHIDNVDTGKPSRGIQGIKGDTGLTGAKGEQGIQGIAGNNGIDGITPNIGIGTVTTLEPNQAATVSRTGTDEAPIFNFGIPKGIQGESIDNTLTIIKSASYIELTTNPYQYIYATMEICFRLPTIEENDNKIHEIHLYYYSDIEDTAYFSDLILWQSPPTMEANKMIELIFTYMNGMWLGREIIYNIPVPT